MDPTINTPELPTPQNPIGSNTGSSTNTPIDQTSPATTNSVTKQTVNQANPSAAIQDLAAQSGVNLDDKTNQSSINDPDVPDKAADTDIVEKAWVNKAKRIVADTKDNPYQQKKRLSALMAEYMKKRYDKDIALSD